MLRVRIYHNPRCSKSRAALQLLEECGVEIEVVRYLEEAPSRQELERLYGLLGPAMVRNQEPLYEELQLAQASLPQLLDDLAKHTILIERPIVMVAENALLARPAELVLNLLESSPKRH